MNPTGEPLARPRVLVVGSLVQDVVFEVDRLPRPHETLRARSCALHLGGKGFNQAVAAARLGAAVTMVGRVGRDPFGAAFHEALAEEGIEDAVLDGEEGTALGVPLVLPGGGNAIVGAPGANGLLAPADVEGAAGRSVDLLLVQNEVPLETTALALSRCAARLSVLDPAPAEPALLDLLPRCDWAVPNEVEAAALVGQAVEDVPAAFRAARALLERGPRRGVVVTLGQDGAVLVDRDGRVLHQPAPEVAAIDPTGAGDAFRAAFGVALARGEAPDQALARGCVAGALAAGIRGARPSMPAREALDAMMERIPEVTWRT